MRYNELLVKYVGGDPRLAFYDEDYKQVGEEINVSQMNEEQIMAILDEKGFKKLEMRA